MIATFWNAKKPSPDCWVQSCFCWDCLLLCLHSHSKLELLAGRHTGDLEIQYEQGDLVYASLTGQCAEVDVQLSQEVLSLQPTYVHIQSQRCFRSGFYCLVARAATRLTMHRQCIMSNHNVTHKLCTCCHKSLWCSIYIYKCLCL